MIFQCDDARKLLTQPPSYLSLSEHWAGSDHKLNSINAVHVETQLCSTKFTQNGIVLHFSTSFIEQMNILLFELKF